jgi:murein DD-endopeptidase MepM/ murein hydrolase activator NlpD
MKRTLFLIILLLLIPGWWLLIRNSPEKSMPLTSTATPQRFVEIEQAIRQAIEIEKLGHPAYVLLETHIDNIQLSQDNQWATAWLIPIDPENGQIIPTEPGLAIVQRQKDSWRAYLPSHPAWSQMAQQAPVDLLPPSAKETWLALEDVEMKALLAAPYTGYYLPWKAGETMALTQSVGHDRYTPSGSAHYAFDFAKPGYPSAMFDVHASKPGRVFRAVWSHPNGNEQYANYLVLEDTSTSPTTYQLYLHLAQDSIPPELRVIGADVQQGQFIGLADDTGVSSGNHLHFHVHSNPTSYWGVSLDITFMEVTINGGRPRITSDLAYCKSTDICDQTQVYYISANVSQPQNPDTKPPTGGFTSPPHASTISSGVLRIEGWARDDLSGLASAQVLARYDGVWREIGNPFTSSPFSLDWDLCNSQVADGPVALALRLRDVSGNQTSDTNGLLHFTKNYTCPLPPQGCIPGSNQVGVFFSPDFQGSCVLLGIGTHNANTQNDNRTESILVGSNVQVTLFSEASLLGRSESLIAKDANLADNRIGAKTTSSLIIQTRGTAPSIPILLWPANNAAFSSDASITLSWKDTTGATQFQGRLQGALSLTTPWQAEPFWNLSNLPPGNYTWQARARNSGTESAWSSTRAFTIQAPTSSPEQTALSSVPFYETFETGASGWGGDGTWNLTNSVNYTTGGAYSMQYRPGASGYDTGAPNFGYLTSPAISLPSDSAQYLRFWYRYETESPSRHWDQRWVQISVDGSAFTNVLQLLDDAPNYWLRSPAISLAAYAGQNIRVRFHFASIDESLNSGQGWLVDDVSITSEAPPNCSDNDNTHLQATPITSGQTIQAAICPSGDQDFYQFQAADGDQVGIRIHAQALGSPLDSYLTLVDDDGVSVLAENDDVLLHLLTDSWITYSFRRTGTFFIKIRSWDHPTSGALNMLYQISLFKDKNDPVASFTSPLERQYITPGALQLRLATSDAGSGVSHVRFLWHPADWQSGAWTELGQDWNGQDGWNLWVDTTSLPNLHGGAFYALVYDWAGNWVGSGAWNINTLLSKQVFFPLLRAP